MLGASHSSGSSPAAGLLVGRGAVAFIVGRGGSGGQNVALWERWHQRSSVVNVAGLQAETEHRLVTLYAGLDDLAVEQDVRLDRDFLPFRHVGLRAAP